MPHSAASIWNGGAFFHRATLAFLLSSLLIGNGAIAQTAQPVRFAIASQPLAAALSAYGSASGLDLYYDGELVVGHQSTAVEGWLTMDDALRTLLAGTGLVARVTGPKSLTIGATRPVRVADIATQEYFGAIQAQVSRTLCAHAETRPTSADLIIQVWVAPSGEIRHTRILDAADSHVSGDTFRTVLRGLRINAPLPDNLPQPITIAILGSVDGQPNGCAQSTMAR
jgi:hypothetical protein